MPDPEEKSAGDRGEALAAGFLRKIGYEILRRNFRSRLGEIDLIARDGEEVVFVEVKTRSSERWGEPEDAVTRGKQRRLYQAAKQFADHNRLHDRTLRFDVVSVLLADGREPEFTHFKDAFAAPRRGR